MSVLNRPHFSNEKAAFAYVESVLWPQGPVCPHCGTMERAYRLEGVRSKASEKNPEGVERFGLWKCGECRKQFTVRKNTIFEESHCPLHKWLQAIHLMCSSKKGISAHQMHRVLEVQYKTAWFLEHRIREAMRSGDLRPFGGGGSPVEVDETFIGTEPGRKKRSGYGHKMKVLSLVDRASGTPRSMVIDKISAKEIVPILRENIAIETLRRQIDPSSNGGCYLRNSRRLDGREHHHPRNCVFRFQVSKGRKCLGTNSLINSKPPHASLRRTTIRKSSTARCAG